MMHSKVTDTLRRMMSLPLEVAQSVWEARARADASLDELEAKLLADGYERVECESPITEDGRQVLRFNDRAYALRPEVHKERLATEFEAEKAARLASETKSVVGTESISTLVCPKCAAGKLGYRHRYLCVCGGADIVSKEAL